MSYLLSSQVGAIPGPPGESSVYLDIVTTLTGNGDPDNPETIWDPGLAPPDSPTEWEIFINGVRYNHGIDWNLLPGGIIQIIGWSLNNDLVTLRYPASVI